MLHIPVQGAYLAEARTTPTLIVTAPVSAANEPASIVRSVTPNAIDRALRHGPQPRKAKVFKPALVDSPRFVPRDVTPSAS